MSDQWWTPARRKLYNRQTPNGITCQSCGHDVCQCSPRAATIGEHVDAVLAAKDTEIERLRAQRDDEIDHLRDRLFHVASERDEARDEIDRLQSQLDAARDHVGRLQREVEAAQAAMERAGYREHKHTAASAIEGLMRERDEAITLLRDLHTHFWPSSPRSDDLRDCERKSVLLARLDAALGKEGR